MKTLKFIKPVTLNIDTPYGKQFKIEQAAGEQINVEMYYCVGNDASILFTGGNIAFGVPADTFDEIHFVSTVKA